MPLSSTFSFLSAVGELTPASSPVSWQHVNLHGEFDFSEDALKDSLRFDVEALYAFQWGPPAGPLV